MTATERAIVNQLKENTGASILDSGSAYGRNWEKNKERNFEKEDALTYSFETNNDGSWWLNVSLNVYHFLNAFCELDEDLQKELEQIAKDNPEESWFEVTKIFANKLVEKGWQNEGITNTYNFDNILSQILQYTTLTNPEGDYCVLMQIHNGCDCRSGYTKPIIYKLYEYDYFLMAMCDLDIYCKNHHVWYSDDSGYNWYNDSDKLGKLNNYKLQICDGKGFCPICNSELSVSARLEY